MSQENRELTAEELEAQNAAELPDREAMSLIDANVAAPVNAAVAANVLTEDSVAYADADQDVVIDQSNS
jgi:predicted nucleic acid-binding protein